MQTLTQQTTIRWIANLVSAIEGYNRIIDSDAALSIPDDLWNAMRKSRTDARLVCDELLELVVAPVEVETADV